MPNKFYINRCLQLAKNGLGNVAPNPMVGCVIVCEDTIIGEGFHMQFGGPHAEVNALNSVKNKDLLKKSSLFVNLEPCAHYGKTPPCADLIVENEIPRVIIGTIDPFAKVAGKGIEILKKGGCEVKVGFLEKECNELNKRFFHFHQQQRPYLILKWAQTIDGFIDKERTGNCEAKPNWITNENTRILVHKWRSEEDAILVGTKTALNDNPGLDTRDWKGKNPLRLVIDRNLSLPKHLKIFNDAAKTIVFTAKEETGNEHLEYYTLDFSENTIPQILQVLFEINIQSLIIEGGRYLLQSFIDEGLWNEARYFVGNTTFGKGIKAPEISEEVHAQELIEEDKLFILKNKQGK